MNIALLSDSHNNWDNLSLAIDLANHEECEFVLFAGDLTVPAGVDYLSAFNGSVHAIFGNGERSKQKVRDAADETENVNYHGDEYQTSIDDTDIFMHHYPKKAEDAAESGEYDLCVHGHTHEYRNDVVNDTRIINPGPLQGPRGSVGFAVYDTDEDSVHEIGLAY